ncbi:E3 ubiquitin/ISG15 ligase TRIM25 [Sardina pilchardus]|uniref:E3 ubiquitin/ISG15 ligase TRIM25 n=1 Tax=Sardina pilchardus TaxID=27697 RepID=UPI002E15A48F
MGATLDTPARVRASVSCSVCPLCHNECKKPTTLRCRHRFCEGCIGELWSGSQSGPYYCPECKQEYRKLNEAVWDTEASSAGRRSSGWRDRLSSRASNSLLGKRGNSSIPQQQAVGQRLGASPTTNGAEGDCFEYLDGYSPPRKKAHPSSNASPPKNHGSARRPSTNRDSAPLEGTSADVWGSNQNPVPVSDESEEEEVHVRSGASPAGQTPVAAETLDGPALESPESSPVSTPTEKISPKSTTPAMDIPPSSRSPHVGGSPRVSGSPRVGGSPRVSGSPRLGGSPQATGSPLTAGQRPSPRNESPSATSAAPDPETASAHRPVLCHYCSGQEQRPAVKTCLQCGASMCADHLRIHLESPVFQGHPLVPAVNDVSPWRCQEHQEMNRIYCRPCAMCVCTVCTVIGSHRDHACISIKEAEKELRGKMKEEIKKLQEHENAVMSRKDELLKKKQAFQEILDEAQANVRNQYQAMREALDQEEQQALRCVSQEEASSLGGVEDQLDLLHGSLTTIQHSVDSLTRLADASGALRVQDQAFIMEYSQVTNRISGLSNPVEDLEAPREVDQGRLECLRGWTESRLDTVVISRPHRDPFRLMYGISPVLDPDSAHPKLLLSMENRRVTFSETPQPYPEREARFSSFPQVLASEALRDGRWYWEVDVTSDEGRWKVGVCEGQIGRKGQKDASRLGFNGLSWCLLSEGKGKVEVLHDKAAADVCTDAPRRVGVLLDFQEGSLSFFSVAEEGALTLLYSYQHAFSQPLYPALAVSKTQLTVCDLFQSDHGSEE